MSLPDALIDEGLTNPMPLASGQVRREAYIAIRNDRVLGSGTPDDPYNGSTPDLLDALLDDDEKMPAKAVDSSSVFGVKLYSGGSKYKVLVLRDNVMRRREAEAPNGNETGIDLTAATYDEAVVDDNLMDVGNVDKGFRHPNTGKIKVFNNLKSDGTLLRGYNTGTGLRDQELTTEVEDVLLGI